VPPELFDVAGFALFGAGGVATALAAAGTAFCAATGATDLAVVATKLVETFDCFVLLPEADERTASDDF
jgi:hypothetical protein